MTSPAPITDLSDRARDIFRLVVDVYIADGQPVGSRTLSRRSSLNLSPASIRNVMQDLEEAGLLAAPHTSAGRVPTQAGLRLFVDGMMQTGEPSNEDKAQIAASINASGPIEAALANTVAALSGLSACAGLVLVPPVERVLKQVAFAPLSGTQALMILVAVDGSVENRIINLPETWPTSVLEEAGNYITATLAGLTLGEAAARLRSMVQQSEVALDSAASRLIEQGLAVWSTDAGARPVLIVRGQAHLIDDGAAEDIERMRLLLDELEAQREITGLLASACDGDAARIFIGAENKLFALSGSSVIAAPYRGGDGRVIGVVGVIGPTRLNYARIVPMVDFTAQSLTRLMQ